MNRIIQWCRSVVNSEWVRVSQVKPSNQKPTEIRFRFRRRKWAFRLFRFRPKMNFYFHFIFRFRSKNVICVGPTMLCSQLNRNWVLWHRQMTFVFVFRPKMEFHFRRHFRLRPKMKSAFSVGLYIKLFQITPYAQQSRFRTAYRCLEKLVLPSIFEASLTSFIIIVLRRRRHVLRVNRCAAPWSLAISDLHSVDSSRALASSWTLMSQTLRRKPGGLL